MKIRQIRTALLTAALAALPALAWAQFPPPPASSQSNQSQSVFPPPPAPSQPTQSQPASPPPAATPTVRDRWPEPAKPAEAQRNQPTSPPAAAPQRPAAQAKPKPDADADAAPAPAPRRKPREPAPAMSVACNGVFVKDSSHLKLAMKYDSRNIIYADVDAPNGKKIKASVLYPNDPRRRLEVVWLNEAARTQLLVIAINGKSQWSAPHGLKLGLPLAALEKANGRPFKISGFGADGMASVLGWEGGTLTNLPGGCKLGIQVRLDPRAPDAARQAMASVKEMMSDDNNLRQAKPTVAEILIGY